MFFLSRTRATIKDSLFLNGAASTAGMSHNMSAHACKTFAADWHCTATVARCHTQVERSYKAVHGCQTVVVVCTCAEHVGTYSVLLLMVVC